MQFNASGQLLQNLSAGAFPANAQGVTGVALAFMTLDTTAPAAESTAVLAQGTVNAPYTQSLTPNGGTGAVTLAVNVTSAIPGLNITGSGTSSVSITGTPTAAGTETFAVTATDALGGTTTTNYTLMVNSAPTLSTSTLPADTTNVAYNQSISATGGTGSVTLTVSNISNAIPGLSITGNGTGSITISGTPTQAGTEIFTVTGTDGAGGTTGPQQYSVTVSTLLVSPGSLPVATVGDNFSQQLTATGGSGTGYRFTLGSHPAWLTLSSTGLLRGTPPATAGAAVDFTVTVADSTRDTATVNYTLNIDPGLVLSPTTLTVVAVGQPFSTQLTAAGGAGFGYTFSIGSHPAWLTLSASGLLSGTPTTAIGSPFHFTVTATDGIGAHGQPYVRAVGRSGAGDQADYIAGGHGRRPVQSATDTDGRLGPRAMSSRQSSLPGWLTLSPTGLLSGTPPSTVLSPVSFAVSLTDGNGDTIGQNYSLTVDPALAVNPGSLPVATVGDLFSQQLTATGGSGTGYRFTLGSHPAWLTLSSTGLLRGTPPATAGAARRFHGQGHG